LSLRRADGQFKRVEFAGAFCFDERFGMPSRV
jgi:hypothetical protein